MQPNLPPNSSLNSSHLPSVASSSASTPPPDRHQRVHRLEGIRTESGKVAAEIFNATRCLQSNPNDGRVKARLGLLRQFQSDLRDMTEAELMSQRPVVITGREMGSTDVPMLLAKAILDEKSYLDEVKRLARTGEVESARAVAKEIVRTRKVKERLYALDAGNKYRTVKAFLEDVGSRIARISEMESLAATVKLGEEAFADVIRFCSQLASDLMLLDQYETEVKRLLKKLAEEQQLDSGRALAKALLEIRNCRAAAVQGVNVVVEKATDDSLRAGIRYMHELPSQSTG